MAAAAADSIMALLLLVFIISQLLPSASCSPPPSSTYYCDWCPRPSTASLSTPAADADRNEDGGACGYGDYSEVHGAPHVAAAGAEFFRDGAGCGACYQLRCRDRRVCGDGGVRVVVTDAANRTGFLLSREAFAAMARRGMADRLAAFGLDNVQVDFRRFSLSRDLPENILGLEDQLLERPARTEEQSIPKADDDTRGKAYSAHSFQ